MKVLNPRSRRSILLSACLSLLTISAIPAFAGNKGSLTTTDSTGTPVKGKLYSAKTAPYLEASGWADGVYYFRVTDPSGAVLLSTDDQACRAVQITGGIDTGAPTVPPAVCSTGYHPAGTITAGAAVPIQICPSSMCNDTPNGGGEYKLWITSVDDYNSCKNSKKDGYCGGSSKTDTFKVKAVSVAYVTACKFNDENGNGTQDSGELGIEAWPITASGVDTESGPIGTVTEQTDATGCYTFSISDFTTNSGQVTITEGSQAGDWQQTAPADGNYPTPNGNATNSGNLTVNVTGGAESLTIASGDTVTLPSFGNTCLDSTCGGNQIQAVVTEDANPVITKTYAWNVGKSVDTPTVYSAGGGVSNAANYTVTVTHDNGTPTAWNVAGTITVSNPSKVPLEGVTVTDAVDDGGTCAVTAGTGINVSPLSNAQVQYSCSYPSLPATGSSTATAAWDSGGTTATGGAAVDFSVSVTKPYHGGATVTDTLDSGTPTSLGNPSYTDLSPIVYQYPHTFSDPSGTCTSHANTSTLVTSDSATNVQAEASVKDCQGSNLSVSKTATGSYTSNIKKTGPATTPVENAGKSTLNYSIAVTESAWQVTGNITVTNPNDWEDVSVSLGDSLSDAGGSCSITGGSTQTVPRGSPGSISPAYTCTFASAPALASATNTATASWNAATYHTTTNSAWGNAGYGFGSLTVTDKFNSNAVKTLGTVTGITASTTYPDSYTLTPVGGTCLAGNNTATLTQTAQTSSVNLYACNTATGADGMGYWKNPGQNVIKAGASTSGVCNLATWLRSFAPFQDLSATATCSATATYVLNVITHANASGPAMNPMLKSQDLATSLDVFFSTPALGGNKIGAPTPVGSVKIDLTAPSLKAGAAFGGATSMTVSQLLSYAASQSNAGGSAWYGQSKSTQELAKDVFDAVSNAAANIAP